MMLQAHPHCMGDGGRAADCVYVVILCYVRSCVLRPFYLKYHITVHITVFLISLSMICTCAAFISVSIRTCAVSILAILASMLSS